MFKIRSLLMTVLALLALLYAVTAGVTISDSIAQYRQARRIDELNSIADDLFRSVQHLGFERGRTNVVLRDSGPLDLMDANREFIKQRQSKGNEALNSALRKLDSSDILGVSVAVADIRKSLKSIDLLRVRAAQDMDVMKDKRDPSLVPYWFDSMSGLINDIGRLLYLVSRDISYEDGAVSELFRIKLDALALRDVAGPENSLILSAFGTGGWLTVDDIDKIHRLQGKIAVHWEGLKRAAVFLNDPALNKSLDYFRDTYFHKYIPTKDACLSAIIAGAPLPVTREVLTPLMVSGLDSISAIMDTAVSLTKDLTNEKMEAARDVLLKASVIAALFLALASYSFFFIKRRVADRFQRITSVMQTLAEGNDADIPSLQATDEIGDMARTVQIFRENSIRRREAEEAIKESEARIRSITDSARDAILMMDAEGRVIFWNPAAERILGYTRDEALGKDLHRFLAPGQYHEAFQSAFPKFLTTGLGQAMGKTMELFAIRKDGEEIAVSVSLSKLNVQGQWHAIGILRDTTERKKEQEKLAEYARQLALNNIQLDAALRQAEVATRAKSQFLANMSHEIRTPMNGIIGITELLLDTGLTGEQHRFASIIRTSGESLLCLINDILDFSKIEAGKLDLETLNFDLTSMLDDFMESMAALAQAKGLELLCCVDQEVPTLLRGDPGRLRQILNNLATNAIKFTHKGEVVVRVSLVEEKRDECMLRFSVRDTGIGIAYDKLGLLFQKFSQVDSSTTRLYGGSGLGLAISKQLAEMMGGEIGVNSVEGQGSEFWFVARLGRQAGESPAREEQAGVLRDVRVLIVDDNATNREILSTRTAGWGMRPHGVEDGLGALKALRSGIQDNDPFRIALIDMQMPGMDGAALGKAIKADPGLAATRMVMLTSMGMRGADLGSPEAGFAAYMSKPLRSRDLLKMIVSVLSEPERTDAHSAATSQPVQEPARAIAEKSRILLAEDNTTNQEVALAILNKLGLQADIAATGQDALAALERVAYDVVLMDVQMPVMDGFEATRRIRDVQSKVKNHTVPIIAMTANAMASDREKCFEAGMDDYVPKPISSKVLAAALRKWLPMANESPADLSEEKPKDSPLAPGAEPLALVFDKKGMLQRMMDDEELAKRIVKNFLDDIPKRIAALKGHLDDGDSASVELQCHTIKGSAANIGGDALSALALAMEKYGAAGDLDEVRTRMNDLEIQFTRLKNDVEKTFLC